MESAIKIILCHLHLKMCLVSLEKVYVHCGGEFDQLICYTQEMIYTVQRKRTHYHFLGYFAILFLVYAMSYGSESSSAGGFPSQGSRNATIAPYSRSYLTLETLYSLEDSSSMYLFPMTFRSSFEATKPLFRANLCILLLFVEPLDLVVPALPLLLLEAFNFVPFAGPLLFLFLLSGSSGSKISPSSDDSEGSKSVFLSGSVFFATAEVGFDSAGILSGGPVTLGSLFFPFENASLFLSGG
mmetsp:Transcript_32369/g.42658  ORF Transcript_32369/g.42658 Transcript_32369/m.42658 type:complete len:241 (+) Transcript_32369:163-885(+)